MPSSLSRLISSDRARQSWAWLGYGAAWAAIAIADLHQRLPDVMTLSGTRRDALSATFLAHDAGFGPLVQGSHAVGFLPAEVSDDPGLYLYLPFLGDIFNTSNVDSLLKWSFLVAIAVLVGVYPVMMRALFDSRLAALASAPLLLVAFRFIADTQTYWVPAWMLALAAPLILLIARRWGRWSIVALAGVVVLASFGNTLRAQTGLGVLVAAIAVAMWNSQRWSQRATYVLVLLLAYASFTHGVLGAAHTARTHRMANVPVAANGWGVDSFRDDIPTGHPFWHTAYIGLGFQRNSWGIAYQDEVAVKYVKRVDPDAAYLSPAYSAALRKRYLEILREHPGYVTQVTAKKAAFQVVDGIQRFPLVILIAPVLLVLATRRRGLRQALILMAPLAIVAFLPALVAIPTTEYELPWLAMLGLLTVLGLCYGLAWVGRGAVALAKDPQIAEAAAPAVLVYEQVASRARAALDVGQRWAARALAVPTAILRRTGGSIGSSRARRVSAVPVAVLRATGDAVRRSRAGSGSTLSLSLRSGLGVAVAATLALVVVGYGVFAAFRHVKKDDDYLFYTQSASPVRPFDTSLPPALESWRFSRLPRGWELAPTQGTRVKPSGAGLDVVTGTGPFEYQLLSPVRRLRPGRYLAVARGRVRNGGMELGVLGVDGNKWINILNFWDGQSAKGEVTMTVPFQIKHSRDVRVILANHANRKRSSRWQLIDVSLRRVGANGTNPARRLASSCVTPQGGQGQEPLPA
jgi:hypothetical protein